MQPTSNPFKSPVRVRLSPHQNAAFEGEPVRAPLLLGLDRQSLVQQISELDEELDDAIVEVGPCRDRTESLAP
jgi:hypothetical protein